MLPAPTRPLSLPLLLHPKPVEGTPVEMDRTPVSPVSPLQSRPLGSTNVFMLAGVQKQDTTYRTTTLGTSASIRSASTPGGGAGSVVQMRKTMGTSNRKAFVSTRLKGEINKPWLEKPDPAQKWARWIVIGSLFLGLALVGIRKSFRLS